MKFSDFLKSKKVTPKQKLAELANGRKFIPLNEVGIKLPSGKLGKDRPALIGVNYDFDKIQARSVSIPSLISVGDIHAVNVEKVSHLLDEEKLLPIDVLEFKGRYFIFDGHHRLTATIMKGYDKINARILEI